jgi:hypothetical protein
MEQETVPGTVSSAQFLEFATQRKWFVQEDLLCPGKSGAKAQGLLRSWRSN